MLQIREDIKKGVYVENLKEIEVTSARDVIQQLIQVYNTIMICSFISATIESFSSYLDYVLERLLYVLHAV